MPVEGVAVDDELNLRTNGCRLNSPRTNYRYILLNIIETHVAEI